MFQSILVPLDGSPFGEHAFPIARNIARRIGARLQLAHVHVAAAPLAVDALPGFDEALDLEHRAREQAYLAAVADRLHACGVADVSAVLLEDPIVTAIHNHAVKSGADLIVMTTHGRGALSRFWLGSVADTLVRRTTLAVLMVRPHDTELDLSRDRSFHRVLIPLDGSALAEQMISRAVALGALDDTGYTLLQAIDPTAVYLPDPQGDGAGDQLIDQVRAAARRYLDRVAGKLRAAGFHVQAETVVGPPAAAILSFARDHAVDLIAMETHGRGGLTRLLLGSVADKVLRSAAVPVLLHRPSNGERHI